MVTEMTTFNELKSTMVVNTGNEAGIYHMYKYVCLLVDVGPVGRRSEIETGQKKEGRGSHLDEALSEESEDED